jgi:peroxiredoxin
VLFLGIPLYLPALLPDKKPPSPLMAGDLIPPGKLISLSGDTISSDFIVGKKMVLLFYSTSCPHCVRELENMRRLENELADSMSIVAISTSTREATVRLLGDNGGVSHVYIDDQRRYTRSFGITAVPAIFLIGEDGRVCYRRVGEAPIAADRQLLEIFRAGEFQNAVLGQNSGKDYR